MIATPSLPAVVIIIDDHGAEVTRIPLRGYQSTSMMLFDAPPLPKPKAPLLPSRGRFFPHESVAETVDVKHRSKTTPRPPVRRCPFPAPNRSKPQVSA